MQKNAEHHPICATSAEQEEWRKRKRSASGTGLLQFNNQGMPNRRQQDRSCCFFMPLRHWHINLQSWSQHTGPRVDLQTRIPCNTLLWYSTQTTNWVTLETSLYPSSCRKKMPAQSTTQCNMACFFRLSSLDIFLSSFSTIDFLLFSSCCFSVSAFICRAVIFIVSVSCFLP